MGEVVQFVPRNSVTRKPMVETLEQQAAAIVGGLSLECSPETLLEFSGTMYESSLGFMAPEKDPA